MTPRPGMPWFLCGLGSVMAGKAMGQWGKQQRLCQRSDEVYVPRQHLCVYGVGDRPGLALWGDSDPRPPSLAKLSINWSINQSITHWVVLTQPLIGRVIHQSHTGAALIGQLTGRPTWGVGQWGPWSLKDSTHLDRDFSWDFCFSRAGTLGVASYTCILSVPVVVGCCFDLHLLQTKFILWNTG